MPSTSAMICAQSAEREPPPTQIDFRDRRTGAAQRREIVARRRRPRLRAPPGPDRSRPVALRKADESAALRRRRCAACARRRDRAGTAPGSAVRRPRRAGRAVRLRRRPGCRASQASEAAADSITPIWCQRPGSAWQKAWTAEAGAGANAVGDAEQHARRSEREERVARRDGAEPDRAGGVVARAAGDHDARSPCPSAARTRRDSDRARLGCLRPAAAYGGARAPSLPAASSDQSRRPTSSQSVPAASDMSSTISPVRLKRT